MESAFERLTRMQQLGINREMFKLAYIIVTTYTDKEDIKKTIDKETEQCTNLRADLMRYCKLAHSVM